MDLFKKVMALLGVLALFVGVASFTKPIAKAAISTIDPRISVETSTDGGATWRTDDPCVNSGDTIQIRTTVWNEGNAEANTVYGGAKQDTGYLRDCVETNGNADGDDYNYNGGFFVDEVTHAHSLAPATSQNDGSQRTITTCRVVGPCDETVTGRVILTSYEDEPNSQGDDRELNFKGFFGRAYAAIVTSNVEDSFTVRVRGEECPERCPGSSRTTAVTSLTSVTSLPNTGGSIIDIVNSIF